MGRYGRLYRGYLFRDRNSWNSDSFQFLPAKTRWLAGGVVGYKLTPQTAINGRFEYYWINGRRIV
jgi:hypothetical protein